MALKSYWSADILSDSSVQLPIISLSIHSNDEPFNVYFIQNPKEIQIL